MKRLHRKTYRKVIMVNKLLFIVCLAAAAFTAPGDNKITALVIAPNADLGTFSIAFITASVIFMLNAAATALIMTSYKPENFVVGFNTVKYKTNQRIIKDFTKAIVDTQSRIGHINYALFLFNRMKNSGKHAELENVRVNSKGKTFSVWVSPKVNTWKDKEVKRMLDILLNKLGAAENDCSLQTLVKYEIDPELLQVLERKGVL